jgi:hypothetical protein
MENPSGVVFHPFELPEQGENVTDTEVAVIVVSDSCQESVPKAWAALM